MCLKRCYTQGLFGWECHPVGRRGSGTGIFFKQSEVFLHLQKVEKPCHKGRFVLVFERGHDCQTVKPIKLTTPTPVELVHWSSALSINSRDSDHSHVTDIFVISLPPSVFSPCYVDVRNIDWQAFVGGGVWNLSSDFSRNLCWEPRAMADGERSPLLSEQHDGTNGFSPGGSSHGYPSKPHSMPAVFVCRPSQSETAIIYRLRNSKVDKKFSLYSGWRVPTCKKNKKTNVS